MSTSSRSRSKSISGTTASSLLLEAVCGVVLAAATTMTGLLGAGHRADPDTPEDHVRVRWRCVCTTLCALNYH
jgi:hypothetical protein